MSLAHLDFNSLGSNASRFTNLKINRPDDGTVAKSSNTAAANASSTQNSNSSQPWYENQKKRTVPSSIVKRTTQEKDAVAAFGALPQQTQQSAITAGSGKENTAAPSHDILFDDIPPTRSLYDITRDDDMQPALSAPTQQLYTNAFDMDFKNKETQPAAAPVQPESAVLVFGYPEAVANQIITHFSKFGTILEEFEVLRQGRRTKSTKKYPIYTGDGWCKLTYSNSSGSLRALQENGSVFGGALIGCVPYSKAAVESLASCTIASHDDIGTMNVKREDEEFVFNPRKIDLQDGKDLFVKSVARYTIQNEQKDKGILSKISNWLFGWEDL